MFLRFHRLGRALYAIGGNAEAARAPASGSSAVMWGIFMSPACLAAIAGLVLTGPSPRSCRPGPGHDFHVFAAAVIGGISLNGGKGTMLGALTGVLLLGVLQNLLTLAGAGVLDRGGLRRDHSHRAGGEPGHGRAAEEA